MSKYIVLKEKESVHGCCNMVVWDFIISWIFVGLVASEYLHLHTAFCILIGLVTSILLIFIMNIKYIGPILQIGISVFWTTQVWDIFKDFEWFQHNVIEDTVWNWTVKIGLTVLFISLHVASFNDFREGDEAFDLPIFTKNTTSSTDYMDNSSNEFTNIAQNLAASYKEVCANIQEIQTKIQQKRTSMTENDFDKINRLIEEFNQKTSDFMANYTILSENANEATITSVFDRCNELLIDLKVLRNQFAMHYDNLEQQQFQKETSNNASSNQNTTQNTNFDSSLFAGCNSKEALTRRYKNLMKTFHPDNADGDTEMAQKIKETYDELLKEYT